MTYYLAAKNEIEAETLAIRKFFANDRRVSMLSQVTTNKPVYKCSLVNGNVKVERVK